MRKFNVNVNGKIYVVEIEETDLPAPVTEEKKPEEKKQEKKPETVPEGGNNVTAPMPGTILDVKVKTGDRVKAGQVLCLLEAMKMENEMVAPADGTVTFVIAKGSSVNTGDTLASLS